jgi:hypothetical protein
MTDLDSVTVAKLREERLKLRMEARKIRREIFWQPVTIAASLMGAGAGLFAALTGLVLAIIHFSGK